MVPINNSGTDQRIPLRKLTLYNAAPQHVQRHSELKTQAPIFIQKETFRKCQSKEKSIMMTAEEEEDPHGSYNPEEAKDHIDRLGEALMTT